MNKISLSILSQCPNCQSHKSSECLPPGCDDQPPTFFWFPHVTEGTCLPSTRHAEGSRVVMFFISGLYKTKSSVLPYACWELLSQLTSRQYLWAGTTRISMEGCQMRWNLAGWVLILQSVSPAHACVSPSSAILPVSSR